MMKGPLTFYVLNMNAQVLIDLAGLLERYAITFMEELFKSLRSVRLFSEVEQAIKKILEKKFFLDDLSKYLITLGLWDKGDEKLLSIALVLILMAAATICPLKVNCISYNFCLVPVVSINQHNVKSLMLCL
jgi:hypothetical protein